VIGQLNKLNQNYKDNSNINNNNALKNMTFPGCFSGYQNSNLPMNNMTVPGFNNFFMNQKLTSPNVPNYTGNSFGQLNNGINSINSIMRDYNNITNSSATKYSYTYLLNRKYLYPIEDHLILENLKEHCITEEDLKVTSLFLIFF